MDDESDLQRPTAHHKGRETAGGGLAKYSATYHTRYTGSGTEGPEDVTSLFAISIGRVRVGIDDRCGGPAGGGDVPSGESDGSTWGELMGLMVALRRRGVASRRAVVSFVGYEGRATWMGGG